MPKPPKITEDEVDEFRSAMRNVKKLTHTKASPVVAKPKPKVRPKEEIIHTQYFSDFDRLEPVSGDEMISFARPGIQHKILRKLRTGQYNSDVILDLHGKNVMAAKKSLSDFLQACQSKGIRHVLIIHGKGRGQEKPILKNKLNHWLREAEQVLAFCSASKHGRGGALYVLLKGEKSIG
jgi:DNA-nicking Smr family endonuclease